MRTLDGIAKKAEERNRNDDGVDDELLQDQGPVVKEEGAGLLPGAFGLTSSGGGGAMRLRASLLACASRQQRQGGWKPSGWRKGGPCRRTEVHGLRTRLHHVCAYILARHVALLAR